MLVYGCFKIKLPTQLRLKEDTAPTKLTTFNSSFTPCYANVDKENLIFSSKQ